MWYVRNILVLPDVRIAMGEQAKEDNAKVTKKEKKGFFGFFKNLFKKKNKKLDKNAKVDSLATAEPQELDSTGAVIPKKVKKKGLFGFLKRKPKVDAAAEQKRLEDAKKEEEEKF
jgi:hypothetical protein